MLAGEVLAVRDGCRERVDVAVDERRERAAAHVAQSSHVAGQLNEARLGGREAGLDRLVADERQLRSGGRPGEVRHRADDARGAERDQHSDRDPDGGEGDAADLPLHRPAS